MAESPKNKDQKITRIDTPASSRATPEKSPGKSPKNVKTGDTAPAKVVEHGGPKGLEPTRYGDWEKNGRCTDF